MTDAEIIKCLECRMPFDKVCVEAYDLINRQKAEYEDLYKKYCELAKTTNKRVPVLIKEVQKSKAKLRAEAIKEFAERLCKDRVSNDPVVIAVKVELEMAGDTE